MFKKLTIVVIALFLFGGSALAFAWWDSLETNEDVTIGVGEGVTISVNLDEQTEGDLVPEGVVMKDEDVTEVDIDFTVTLDRTDLAEELDLLVNIDNIEIDGVDTHAGLVQTSIDNPGTIQNAPVEVTVTVTLDEPADQSTYDEGANKDITFDVTFEAQQQD